MISLLARTAARLIVGPQGLCEETFGDHEVVMWVDHTETGPTSRGWRCRCGEWGYLDLGLNPHLDLRTLRAIHRAATSTPPDPTTTPTPTRPQEGA